MESVSDDRCGTYAGYQAHKWRGDNPCEPCRAANAAYHREHRKQKPRRNSVDTRRAKLRNRALARLADEYPKRFAQLLREEYRRDMAASPYLNPKAEVDA